MAVVLGLIFVFPFASSDIATKGFLSDKKFDIFDNPLLTVLAVAGMLSSLVAVFLFKNRIFQLRLNYLAMVAAVLVVVAAIVLFYNEAKMIFDKKQEIADSFGLYLPFISIVLGFFAAKYIRKDEKVVKDMDRLR
jgi:ABC-type branched-subunit amino acid transport system permease subunit